MAKRNLQLVQDSVNGLETSNGVNVAEVTGAVTDNAIARFNGTTGAIQGSGVVVDDSGAFVGGQAINTAELITNGTFDTNTNGWDNLGTVLTIEGQKLKIVNSNGGTNGSARQSFPTVIGKKYLVTFDTTSGSYNIGMQIKGDSVGITGWNLTGKPTGTYSYVYTATTTTTYLLFSPYSTSAGAYGFIDNVSVKEVPLTTNSLIAVSTTAIGGDNTLPRWDAKTGALQDSGVVVDDSGNLIVPTGIFTEQRDETGPAGVVIDFPNYLGTDGRIISRDTNTSAYKNLQIGALNTLFVNGGFERMRIDSSGNVGIGTSSPSVKLEVKNTDSNNNSGNIKVSNDTGSACRLQTFGSTAATYGAWTAGDSGLYTTAGSTVIMTDSANGIIKFATNGPTERMRIDSSGNVGIGTSDLATKLNVVGNALGSVAGNESLIAALGAFDGNASYLQVKNCRVSNGSDHTTAELRIQKRTDSTEFGYIGFGASGDISFGRTTDYMRIRNGNLGLGVTPSAWQTEWKALELSGKTVITDSTASTYVGRNWYRNTSYQIVYKTSDFATMYEQNTGQHKWFTAPSGTVGSPITWTTAMTLDNSGNLGLGVTPSAKLHVTGGGAISSTLNVTGGNGSDNGVIASDFNLVFQTNANANQSNRSFDWRTGGKGYSDGTLLMLLSSSGNLGLGVTPSAWGSSYKVLQYGYGTSLSSFQGGGGETGLNHNAYFNGSDWIYILGGNKASRYSQDGTGAHTWRTAPSGTAGNAITWTTAMTLDASGNMGLGVTPSAAGSQFRELDIGSTGALFSYAPSASSSVLMGILCNAYSDGTNYKYKQTREATGYQQYNGSHQFFTAPSGTAGNNVTFTTALTIPNTGGIQLPNTAITNATTLDWYEEGTFTPTIVGTTTAGTGTYPTQYGRYTRIGDRVHINFRIVWTAHTGTGNISIGGLPFASNAEVGNFAANVLYPLSDLTYSGGSLGISISQGLSVLSVYTTPVSTGSASSVAMDASGTLLGNITYRV